MLKKYLISFFLLLVVFCAGLIFLYFSKKPTEINFLNEVNSRFENSYLVTDVSLENSSKREIELNLVLLPLDKKPDDLIIYYYFDEDYPTLQTSVDAYLGLYNFLVAGQLTKRFNHSIELVNADKLSSVFTKDKSIVIIASGVLPNTVFSKDRNLISPWLEKGGCLIWVGDGLGYYSARKEEKIEDEKTDAKIGWEGQKEILKKNFIDGDKFAEDINDSIGEQETIISRALDLRYQFTLVGAINNIVFANDGYLLGYNRYFNDTLVRNSISFIPVGEGGVVIFGAGIMEKQRELGWDISQIIISELIFSEANNLKYESVRLSPQQKKRLRIEIKNKGYEGGSLIIFDKAGEVGNFYYKDIFYNLAKYDLKEE